MAMTWVHRTGRDRDGDKFSSHLLVHDSERILARIHAPQIDEYIYDVSFKIAVPDEVLASNDYNHEFMSESAAKTFVEDILSRFDPFAAPKQKEKK